MTSSIKYIELLYEYFSYNIIALHGLLKQSCDNHRVLLEKKA